MDDLDWNHLVHFGRQGCRHANWFMWLGGGGALNDVEVECPDCHDHHSMGWAYGRAWHCSAVDPRMTHQTPPSQGQGIVRKTLGLFKDRHLISIFLN